VSVPWWAFVLALLFAMVANVAISVLVRRSSDRRKIEALNTELDQVMGWYNAADQGRLDWQTVASDRSKEIIRLKGELDRLHRITEWYEMKHQQRRTQVTEAQEDARRMQEKERDTFEGLQDCADQVDELRKALAPFAAIEECEHGVMIGDGAGTDHAGECLETRRVLKARKARGEA
jgi:TolA-binding protein